MAHNPITLDLLRALDAIDKRGSFAAAAQALHKVPSALTYTIQKVEQDLGIDLFDRSGHRAKLTEAGRLILNRGRLVLRDIDALADSAQKIAGGWESSIGLCIDTMFDTTALYPLVARFNQQHDFVRVNISRGSISGTWEQLLSHKADLIVTGDITDPKLDSYETRSLGELQTLFVVSREHPLAQQPRPVHEDAVDQYPTIIIPDSSQMFGPKTLGWTRQTKTIAVASMAEKISAQKAGLGVGYLPKNRIEQELASGELVDLGFKPNPVQVILAWRRGRSGPALQWFLDQLTGQDIGVPQ